MPSQIWAPRTAGASGATGYRTWVAGFVLVGGKRARRGRRKGEGILSAEDRNGKVSTDEGCTTRERSFDELTKGLAGAAVSRRGALRLLAGALFGGALASAPGVAQPAQAATCANGGQSCTAQKCCRGFTCLVDQTSGTEKFCCPTAQVCGQTCCPTGGTCVNRQCICINGLDRCFTANDPIGTCRNLQNDNNNCGECALACNTTAGEACCSGVCKNLLEDEQNCGLCGKSCGANETCVAGACCPNTRVCGNTCLATACSATNCEVCDPVQGKCVSTCSANETCLAGACCPNTRVCGSTCLATACDPSKCEVCSVNPTTGAGQCVSTCTGSRSCCGGVCRELNTVTNCGGCGVTCDTSKCEVCQVDNTGQFRCVSSCGQNQQCQNGSCVNVCSPATCTGCCDSGTCRTGNTNQLCGTGGAICISCPSGTGCQSGTCVCGANGSCSGCCQNGVCQAGNTNLLCGSGGGTCVTCTGTDVCCAAGQHAGSCKRPTGATCTGNGQCCSNRCRNGVCA